MRPAVRLSSRPTFVARTGKEGDGVVFVMDVAKELRIRTGTPVAQRPAERKPARAHRLGNPRAAYASK